MERTGRLIVVDTAWTNCGAAAEIVAQVAERLQGVRDLSLKRMGFAPTTCPTTPVLEELFWRGWMMRWLIDHNFLKVPLGKYTPTAFWVVALLFASEHGPYWEVGLAAGIIYNWWLVRTRSLADCILAHGVTNALLCAWVLATGQWQYWL